jgi:hypothetical protein
MTPGFPLLPDQVADKLCDIVLLGEPVHGDDELLPFPAQLRLGIGERPR